MRWQLSLKKTAEVESRKLESSTSILPAQLIVRNTSPYPTGPVESILRFAFAEVLHTGTEIHVKGSKRSFRGRAYDGIPHLANVSNSARYLVTIGLSRTVSGLPVRVNPGTRILQRQYAKGLPVDGWEDVLVYVAAHEARHIWQFYCRNMGKKVALSELDADKFAIYQLNAWRLSSERAPLEAQR
jgi:hypothetical protein